MGRVARVLAATIVAATAVGVGAGAAANADAEGHGRRCGGSDRQTERLVRSLFDQREVGDGDAIWDMFADGGVITFPFTGDANVPPAVYRKPQDEALFKAQIGGLLAALADFQLTDLEFRHLEERGGAVVTYNGTATVLFTGKPLDTRFITEVHLQCGLFTSYAEYYDTSVLQAAFAA